MSVTKFTRQVTDTFEAGGEARRAIWPNHYFRETFGINHTDLTQVEMDVLRDFYGARTGEADEFWFRDSINRTGNHRVRFGEDFRAALMPGRRSTAVQLVETGVRRALPSVAEIEAAVGYTSPLVYLDPDREAILTHLGAKTFEARPWDPITRSQIGQWNGLAPRFDGLTEPKSYYRFTGGHSATGPTPAGFSAGLGGAVFAIVRATPSANRQAVFSVGRPASGQMVSLTLEASGSWSLWTGATAYAIVANSPVSTWVSLLINIQETGVGVVDFDINGVLTSGTLIGALDRSNPIGWSLGAAPDDTSRATTVDVGLAMWFPAPIPVSAVGFSRNLHNLFAYQFGLPLA